LELAKWHQKKKIKQENKINFFDVVLIDGSEFIKYFELDGVCGARFILYLMILIHLRTTRTTLGDYLYPNYSLVTQSFSLP